MPPTTQNWFIDFWINWFPDITEKNALCSVLLEFNLDSMSLFWHSDNFRISINRFKMFNRFLKQLIVYNLIWFLINGLNFHFKLFTFKKSFFSAALKLCRFAVCFVHTEGTVTFCDITWRNLRRKLSTDCRKIERLSEIFSIKTTKKNGTYFCQISKIRKASFKQTNKS